MDTIYRIENKKGKGCYHNLKDAEIIAFRKLMPLHDDFWKSDKCHPLPENDYGIKRKIRKNEICGFLTLQQLHNWFTKKELKVCHRLGYDIKKIKVQKITAKSQFQVLAIR